MSMKNCFTFVFFWLPLWALSACFCILCIETQKPAIYAASAVGDWGAVFDIILGWLLIVVCVLLVNAAFYAPWSQGAMSAGEWGGCSAPYHTQGANEPDDFADPSPVKVVIKKMIGE